MWIAIQYTNPRRNPHRINSLTMCAPKPLCHKDDNRYRSTVSVRLNQNGEWVLNWKLQIEGAHCLYSCAYSRNRVSQSVREVKSTGSTVYVKCYKRGNFVRFLSNPRQKTRFQMRQIYQNITEINEKRHDIITNAWIIPEIQPKTVHPRTRNQKYCFCF